MAGLEETERLPFGRRLCRAVQGVSAAWLHSYQREGGWQPAALDRMGAELLLDGGRVRLLDASGSEVWSYVSSPSAGAAAPLHRERMGEGSLGPERSLPIYDQRTRVGTALVLLPTPGLMPHDREFRAAVNRMLLVGVSRYTL